MAQVTVRPSHVDLPLGGAGRAVAGLVAALTLHALNRVLSQPGIGLGSDPTKLQCNNEFIYTITGQILRCDFGGADVFDFTGLSPVPPGNYQRYFLLVDRDQNTRIQEATPSPIPEAAVLSNVSTNAYAATVAMLNGGNGWACIGTVGIHVAEDSAAPFVPGTDDFIVGAVLDSRDFIDGFDGSVLLPVVGTGSGLELLV